MRIENWVLQLFCGFLILYLGVWLEKGRDKKTKKWYHGGYLDLNYKWGIWTLIGCGQILIWQGLMVLLDINWISVIGVYVSFIGFYYLFLSMSSNNESSWYNRVLRNKGFAVGLLLIGIFLMVVGW